MEQRVNTLWEKSLRLLRGQLSDQVYQTWFAPIVPVSFENGNLVLQVSSNMVVDQIEDNYISIFSRIIFRVFGAGTKVDYRILIDSKSGAGIQVKSDKVPVEEIKREVYGSKVPKAAQASDELPPLDSRLNPTYTFESFVLGECNKVVRTIGMSAAKAPGNNPFNPLFIYGGSGVGKTHLLNAIGNLVKQLYPSKRVLYLSANEFKTQYMQAGQSGHVSDFLQFYQTVDVLLIDDIQFLAGPSMQKTQEQFFHIFNYLHQSRKQIVMTSDRAPQDIKDLEDRLLTRFRSGFQGEMMKPDYSLRKDILKNKMGRDGVELPDEVISFIAENVRDNVRDLEGVLVSLLAYSTVMNSQIDLALVERVVGSVVDIAPAEIPIADIVDVVCAEFSVQPALLNGASRQQTISMARQVSMYFAKRMTKKSLQEIGRYFGGRSHATVLHAFNTITDQVETNPVLARQIKKLEAKLAR